MAKIYSSPSISIIEEIRYLKEAVYDLKKEIEELKKQIKETKENR